MKKEPQLGQSLWQIICAEAEAAVAADPVMGSFLRYFIMECRSPAQALALRLTERLHHKILDRDVLLHSFSAILAALPRAEAVLEADLRAVYARDPACTRFIEPLLYYKGFHALQTHRIAHAYGRRGGVILPFICKAALLPCSRPIFTPRRRLAKLCFWTMPPAW